MNKELATKTLARLAMLRGWCVAGRNQESMDMFALIELELTALEADIKKEFGYRYDPVTKSSILKIDDELSAGQSPRDILRRLADPAAGRDSS